MIEIVNKVLQKPIESQGVYWHSYRVGWSCLCSEEIDR